MRQWRVILACVATTLIGAGGAEQRPPITGVSHLAVYSRDMVKSAHFYTHVLGARKGVDPEHRGGMRFYFSARQFVEVLPAPPGLGASMLAHTAYVTTDAVRLRAWLAARGMTGLGPVQGANGQDRWFVTHDPEGNEVQFVQPASPDRTAVAGAIGSRIIHVGYVVHDRAGQDRFYRRMLGFRPYWFGAFVPPNVDWVSQQVPDGRDWMEYMMVGPGSGVPIAKVDANQLGVLNHLSLGVANMQAAVTTLYGEDRLSPRHDGPEMGLDGKWQANFYDPDGTRIELMEFQPAMKPCCSPFTAESPAD
jgi:catechol 2,3-dioxygenase-like lactoylglutathione lyase family enzyme